METRSTRITSSLLFIAFLITAISAHAQKSGPRKIEAAQETIVTKIGVARMTSATKKSSLDLVSIQEAIVKVLTDRSYVDAVIVEKTASPQDENSKLVNLAREKSVDAVLTGEFESDSVKMSLRSGLTGRSLVRWTFPIAQQRDKNKEAELLKNIVDTIVRDFPYRGYIMFVKGDNVQMNLGSRHAIRAGVRLSVFEFEGSRPTFGSPKIPLGEVIITKVSANLAVGKIKTMVSQIKKFAKVDIYVAQVPNLQEHEIRYSRKGWVGGGLDFQFMDTQTSDNPDMIQRRYKLTLSPFLRLVGGYGRFAGALSYGVASNQSNDVSFLMANGSAELYQADLGEDTSLITSGGFTFSTYTATSKGSSTAPLVSNVNYSGLIEQAVHYKVTASTRFFGFGHLLYPYFSSDKLNKESSAFTSFGFGFGGGLRIYLFPNFAVESLISSRMTNWAMISGNIQEIQYGLTLQGLYFY